MTKTCDKGNGIDYSKGITIPIGLSESESNTQSDRVACALCQGEGRIYKTCQYCLSAPDVMCAACYGEGEYALACPECLGTGAYRGPSGDSGA